MNLKDLQKKVAEILGVSNSQSELAFEVFAERIYESLYEGITLKIPRIGFFQLKTGEVKNGSNRPVIFTPLSVDFSRDTNNLYLTFEVQPKTKNTREIDSNVFSIGVGKPLLPLTIDDLPNSETSFAVLKKSIEERAKELISESDQIPNFNIFEDYYKFSSLPLAEDETHSTLSDLTSDIDFSNIPHEPLQAPSEEKYDLLTSLIEELPAETEHVETGRVEIPKIEFDFQDSEPEKNEEVVPGVIEENVLEESLDAEGKTSEMLLAELLFDHSPEIPKDVEEKIHEERGEHPEQVLDTIDVSEFLNREETPIEPTVEEEKTAEVTTQPEEQDKFELPQTPETVTETPMEINPENAAKENLSQPEEQFIEEHYADEQNEEKVQEDKLEEKMEGKEEEERLQGIEDELEEEQEEDLEPFEELLDSEKPSEEKIEWNWGDELREEFGLGHLESEEAKYEMVDDKRGEQKIEPEPEAEKDSIRDLFAQLEKTLEHDRTFLDEEPHEEKKPTVEAESPTRKHDFKDDEKVYLEYSGPPSKYEFIPVKTSEEERHSRMAISLAEEPSDYFDRRLTRTGDREERLLRQKQKEESSNSKMYLLYIAVFAVVSVAVYLVMRNNSEPADKNLKPTPQNVSQTKIDSIKTAVENAPDSSKYLLEQASDFPISATPPVPVKGSQSSGKSLAEVNAPNTKNVTTPSKQPETKQSSEPENGLYKTPKNDTRITNSIYFDGKNYNFQASSWRNKATAEQEVQRLRALNFKAYLVEAYLPQKGGTWYRVRIGPFGSENETRQFMRENNFK